MKSRNIGPYSRRHRLGYIDRRTHEGKLLEEFRADLVEHCGGAPNTIQSVLIERAARMQLRLAMMDSKVAAGDLHEHDSRVYLAWANTLRRTLVALGVQSATTATGATTQPLDQYLKLLAARNDRSAAD
jgi:hypothetical protein